MKPTHIPSIFNDVMGPVMRGDSSSHTAAAHRIASIIRQVGKPNFTKVIVKFDRTGSLATTYLGHGSAMGLAGGLLRLEMTDAEIINYEKHLENSHFTIEYIITDIENKHPNAYQISVQYPDREELNILAISTGEGMFEIVEWEKFKVSIKGDFFESLLFFQNEKEASKIEQILNANFSDFKVYKSMDTNGNLLVNIKSGSSLHKQIENILGLNKKTNQKLELIPVMPVPSVSEISLPFTTVDEMLELASNKDLCLSDLAILYESVRTGLDTKAFLAAGITSVFIAAKYTFSAEEGGCQVETGSGAAMAASNALNSSIMALAGYDPVIPYNEVIDAMKAVGEALPSAVLLYQTGRTCTNTYWKEFISEI
jgi:L-serine dehydratase